MKTVVFNLAEPVYKLTNKEYDIYDVVFKVPSLPAYAVLNHKLDRNSTYMGEEVGDKGYELDIDEVIIRGVRGELPGEKTTAILTIYYSGIRDYSLLFPQVNNDSLKKRLGQFSEEADKAFESGSWMSFVLMAASVIEGILIDKYGKKNFNELIDLAYKKELLKDNERILLHEAREIRNRVHANRHKESYPDRKTGNDLYVVYDQMIKKNWAVLERDK